ncbi:hypothetical protein [Methanolobus psychrotolerans]|uniref:hypothetical protein n=1 Tax=Methanolobus psychrotolerans TaxID=1874706 RepID=UPI0013ED697B|nr:hypothetical protein [Methanolobus psychrotolerans]
MSIVGQVNIRISTKATYFDDGTHHLPANLCPPPYSPPIHHLPITSSLTSQEGPLLNS